MLTQVQILDGPIQTRLSGSHHGLVDGYTVVLREPTALIIGQVDVIRTTYGFYETHSHLGSDYHNNGYGIMMYAAAFDEAIKRRFDLRSSLMPTADARAVWCSRRLRARYDVKKVGRRYRLLGRA